MLQGDQNGHDGFFLFRPVNIHAVFIMNGEHLLADDGDDLPGLVIQFKVQAGDVSPQDPSEPFNIRNILYKVPQFTVWI